MVLPVIAVAARGVAAAAGRAGVSRGAAAGASQKAASGGNTGKMSALQRARQARRDVRGGKAKDKHGRTAANAKFTGEKPSVLLYLGVSMIALLKDLLDLVGIGSLPGIGTVVTFCFTFLIWILLAIFDRSSQNTKSNIQLIRGLVVIAFGLVEAIGFGLNFMPIETAMVIVLYQLARRAYRKAKKEAEKHPAPEEPAYA